MTTDLATLALHEPFIAFDSVMISDGTIANIGSFTLTSLPTSLLFTNVLHVPAMSKNLILVFALCANNPIIVLFFESLFQVHDRHMGVTMVREHRRDGVYYWQKSVPLWTFTLVLSSSIRSSFSMWYSCLGHPSLHIFLKFLSVLNISFPEEHLCSFSCNFCHINKSHKLPFAKSSITSSSPSDIIFSDV